MFRNEDSQVHPAILKFVNALDGDEFSVAKALLANNCRYDYAGKVIVGPDEIIAPYQTNSERAKATFDSVVYESRIESFRPFHAVVRFKDRLTKNGRSHEFKCRQLISVDVEGRISLIQHEEIEGERERLSAYLRQCGITWSS